MPTPQWSRLLADSTEYFGRFAALGNLSVVVGRIIVFNPAALTIACVKSNHVHSPRLVTCTTPLAPLRQSWMIARAKSTASLGDPSPSSTTSPRPPPPPTSTLPSATHPPPL